MIEHLKGHVRSPETCSRLVLSVDVIFDLFDRTIVPIVTNGCEVWGHEMTEMASKLQLQFYKLVLMLRQSTHTLTVYGEEGKYTTEVLVKSRLLCFWLKLRDNDNKTTLSSIVYTFLLKLYLSQRYHSAI